MTKSVVCPVRERLRTSLYAAAVIGACVLLTVAACGHISRPLALSYFLFCILCVSCIDLVAQTIPNAIVLLLWMAGLGVNALGAGWVPWQEALLSSMLAWMLLGAMSWVSSRFPAFSFGMGDAKFIGAVSAWGGWSLLYGTVLWGSVLAILWLVGSRRRTTPLAPFYAFVGGGLLGVFPLSV